MPRPNLDVDAYMRKDFLRPDGGIGGYISIPEAADRSKRYPSTIHRWARAGKIKSFKTGGRLYVDERDLARLIGGILSPG